MNLYYVDPNDTSSDGIWRLPRVPYTGDLPDGRPVTGLAKAEPDWDVYEELDNRTEASDEYFNTTDVTEFVGDVGSDAARVVVSSDHQRQSSQDIYDDKIVDLNRLYNAVRDQGVTVTLPSNGAQDMRSTIDAFTTYVAAHVDEVLPGTTNTADEDVWELDIIWQKRDVPPIATQLWLLYASANGVRNDHRDELRRLLQADDAEGLAAYDYSTGWPAPPTPPPGTSASDIGTTRTVPLALLAYVFLSPKTRPKGKDPQKIMRFLHKNEDVYDDLAELETRWIDAPENERNGR